MRFKIPQTLKAILLGSVIGGVSSVLLSLTLEPEISEVRMGQYGAFIGLIASSVTSATLTPFTRKDDQSKPDTNPNKLDSKPEFNPILAEIVIKATNNHLNALLPGSPEYFKALELYGKLLSGENGTPNTNTPKTKTLHRNDGD